MVNIITSVCIDVDELGSDVLYPNLSQHSSPDKRREIYWQCATTFCISSMKFNEQANHIIVTNDFDQIIVDGLNIKDNLIKLGVKIIEHPFDVYDPKKYSKKFRNAFYKFEVVDLMSKLDSPSILVDADCIWTKKDNELLDIIRSENFLLLQDTYQSSLNPEKKFHNLSIKDIAELYKTIPINNFDSDYAIRYGGELIGGSPKHFKIISAKLLLVFEYCKQQFDLGNEIKFNNGFSIFSGMEFISSYIYNSLPNFKIYDTYGKFSKRLYTGVYPNNVKENDIEITIWHLPAEKDSGLQKLFKEIANYDSPFWKMEDGLQTYFGSYLGIPKHN